MVMIIVVILIAAITTIIAASVDLSRMAVYKQNQAEREAKWQYCVDSGQAFVVEDLVALAGTTQSFSKTVNGINLAVSSAPDLSWNELTSTKLIVTGTIDGKSRTTELYVGKRQTVNPCKFGLFVTTLLEPDSNVVLTGDAYAGVTTDAERLSITGDLYCPNAVVPTIGSLTGSYLGRQPTQSITLDRAAYSAQAAIFTSGNLSLTNPTYIGSGAHSQLRYHTGDLTIQGSTRGEITIFVDGNVTLDNIVNRAGFLGRLVIISTGDVKIEPGTCEAFVIASGKVGDKVRNGARTLNGSLAGGELNKIKHNLTINFDDYFATNALGGFRYWLPGQW